MVNIKIAKDYKFVNKNARFTIFQFKQDVILEISQERIVTQRAKRGVIRNFSVGSARRLRFVLRNLPKEFRYTITLTYPQIVNDIRNSKANLNAFLQWLRRRKIDYVWVAEFQLRGAIHYHLVVNKTISYKEINEKWKGIIGLPNDYVRTEIKQIKKRVEQYFSNYIKKIKQKEIPDFVINMGRYWGSSRGLIRPLNVTVFRTIYKKGVKSLRILNKWYKAKMKSIGIKIKNRNRGRIYWGGSPVIDVVLQNLNLGGIT